MKKRILLSFATLFLFFHAILSNSSFGQSYASLVQFHITPDGTEKYEYHPATIIFFNDNKNLKIFYNEYPNFPFVFTLKKINVVELSSKTGTITQYKTIEDSNYSYLNYNIVLVSESQKMIKLDNQYSYDFDVSIIQKRSNNTVEVMDRFFINRESDHQFSSTSPDNESTIEKSINKEIDRNNFSASIFLESYFKILKDEDYDKLYDFFSNKIEQYYGKYNPDKKWVIDDIRSYKKRF